MSKMNARAIEHHGSVGCHRGKPAQAITRLGAKAAKSIGQAEIHAVRIPARKARRGSSQVAPFAPETQSVTSRAPADVLLNRRG
jgi:hypothetical protein